MYRYKIHGWYLWILFACGRPFRTIEILLWQWAHYNNPNGNFVRTHGRKPNHQYGLRGAWRDARRG